MSIAAMILGESGTGKSTSLRNLNPDNTLLIQAISKPLPFKSGKWQIWNKETNPRGAVFVTDQALTICHAMHRTSKDVIVIDDFQYVMANEFMRRSAEKGFEKFTEIGHNAWSILNTASSLPAHKRVYILAHTQTDDAGRIASAKDMLAAMQQQIKTRETRLDGFKDYLRSCMGIAGISQIKSADGLLTATLYPERDEAVEIDAGADIPEAFCIPPKPPAPNPDKRLLAEAIKAGQPVPEGVRLVKRDRLTIK